MDDQDRLGGQHKPLHIGSVSTATGNRVTAIVLEQTPNDPGNNLVGSIPGSIGNLTGLVTLDLASNELSGSIPTNIGRLKKLTALDLSGNLLTGAIPSQIGGLTSLSVELDLHSNQLTGGLPTSLTNLNAVQILDLGSNSLSGSIAVVGGMPVIATDRSEGEPVRWGGARCDRQSAISSTVSTSR